MFKKTVLYLSLFAAMIFDGNSSRSVGVHTHGGCTPTGGSNKGTSTYNSAFWSAVNTPLPTCEDLCGDEYDACRNACARDSDFEICLSDCEEDYIDCLDWCP